MQKKSVKGIFFIFKENNKSSFRIVFEMTFIQDNQGLEFVYKLIEHLNQLSKEDIHIHSFSGQPSDLTCTVKCSFKDIATLENLLQSTLSNGFYDERTKSIISPEQMIAQVKEMKAGE